MIISSKKYENGKQTGELKFSTGKRVYLNQKEWQEFKSRIRMENQIAIERERGQNYDGFRIN